MQIGSDAVIGVPGVGGGTVQKYTLGGKSMASVTPNIVGQQTLTGTSIAVRCPLAGRLVPS